MSLKASMSPQDWAQISFRTETLSNGFYSEPDRGLLKGRISRYGDFSSMYRVSNFQDFFFLYEISLPKALPIKILINSIFIISFKDRIKVL